MAESNIAMFCRLIRYIRVLIRAVGVDVFDPSDKITGMACITGFFPITIALSYIYLICFSNITISLLLEGSIMMTLVVQGTTKLFLTVFQHKKYHNLYVLVLDLYTSDIRLGKNAIVLSSCAQNCMRFYKLLFLAYGGVFCGYVSFPIFSYIYYDKKMTLFPIYLPFTDPNSTFGFTLNFLHQMIFLLMGVFGVLGYDVVFLINVVHSIAAVNVFRNTLDELNRNMVAKCNKTQQLSAAIRNHQGLINYFENINDTYTVMALVQILTDGIMLSIAVFLWFWKGWIISPVLIAAGTFQLFEFCILGTITQIQNEAITTMIYEMLWYLMPAKDQKMVQLMLLRSQNPTELNAGKFAKLNVETGMKVMKMIYSFAMMMNEVIG